MTTHLMPAVPSVKNSAIHHTLSILSLAVMTVLLPVAARAADSDGEDDNGFFGLGWLD